MLDDCCRAYPCTPVPKHLPAPEQAELYDIKRDSRAMDITGKRGFLNLLRTLAEGMSKRSYFSLQFVSPFWSLVEIPHTIASPVPSYTFLLRVLAEASAYASCLVR